MGSTAELSNEHLGLTAAVLDGLDEKQVTMARARAVRSLRSEAKRHGIDPDRYVFMTREERIRAIEDRQYAPPEYEESGRDPHAEIPPAPVYVEGEIESEDDPVRRDGITIGKIREIETPPVDLVGEHPPRTLTDLYARWPIGSPGGERYYLRVERVQPTSWNGVSTAGYLGKIQRRITEDQFAEWFGGTRYTIQLYGPDPKGRKDQNGEVIVKALTEPIAMVVPVRVPNISVLPVADKQNQESNLNPFVNPYQVTGLPVPQAPPTTASDAAIHKANVDLATRVLSDKNAELEAARRESGKISVPVMEMMKETSEARVRELERQAERREELLVQRIKEASDDKRRIEEQLKKMEEQMQGMQRHSSGDTLEMMKIRDVESARTAEMYRVQLESQQKAHQEQTRQQNERHLDEIRHLNDRHADDLRRAEERLKDTQEHYRRIQEADLRRYEEREKALREEVDRVRREAKEEMDRRVREAEKLAETRLADQEKAHDREVRSIRDSFDVKSTTAVAAKDMELAHLKQRLAEVQEDLDRAREEAKENADPVAIVEKAKAQAEAFGYQKPDENEPKTPMERFAMVAGAGVSQFMAKADAWLPALASAMTGAGGAQAARAAGALPPAQSGAPQLPPPGARQMQPQSAQAQQAQQAQRVRRRISKAAEWATADGPPVQTLVHPVVFPSEAPVVPPQPAQPPSAAQPPLPAQVPPVASAPPPVQEPEPVVSAAEEEQQGQVLRFPESPFGEVFNQEAIVGFLQNCEQAINGGMDAGTFATMFVARYPEEAHTMAQRFQPGLVVEYVQEIAKMHPAAASSPLLRRDGRKWIESLWPAVISAYQARGS